MQDEDIVAATVIIGISSSAYFHFHSGSRKTIVKFS